MNKRCTRTLHTTYRTYITNVNAKTWTINTPTTIYRGLVVRGGRGGASISELGGRNRWKYCLKSLVGGARLHRGADADMSLWLRRPAAGWWRLPTLLVTGRLSLGWQSTQPPVGTGHWCCRAGAMLRRCCCWPLSPSLPVLNIQYNTSSDKVERY